MKKKMVAYLERAEAIKSQMKTTTDESIDSNGAKYIIAFACFLF